MRRSAPLVLLSAAALATVALAAPATAAGRPLDAELLGANEVGAGGDPDGSGTADITVNPGTGQVCFEITVADLDPVILGHIHDAPAGQNGGVVVDFGLTQADFVVDVNGVGTASGCVPVTRAQATEIVKDPSGYYVNIHTTAFRAGALRGQL